MQSPLILLSWRWTRSRPERQSRVNESPFSLPYNLLLLLFIRSVFISSLYSFFLRRNFVSDCLSPVFLVSSSLCHSIAETDTRYITWDSEGTFRNAHLKKKRKEGKRKGRHPLWCLCTFLRKRRKCSCFWVSLHLHVFLYLLIPVTSRILHNFVNIHTLLSNNSAFIFSPTSSDTLSSHLLILSSD